MLRLDFARCKVPIHHGDANLQLARPLDQRLLHNGGPSADVRHQRRARPTHQPRFSGASVQFRQCSGVAIRS